ncbi:hypothetical protein KV697_07980 [Sphingomonas sanguinis]|uniref:hypothetical protein n=1 Tax=Sphingomonas sanguinis TaxID=33051 RepID=UPI001C59019E|nr:hypothetical protein [Sphingomonas sanguinis]QXT37209.1 hypothetical protein KV697_07980 [Sphingomonas sanguinis]
MRQVIIMSLCLVAFGLAGCNRDEKVLASTSVTSRRLTVSGPVDGVRRFAKLQQSRTPALPVSPITDGKGDKAHAVVLLPANYTGQDLIHTAREALAADLDYEYAELRATNVVRKS